MTKSPTSERIIFTDFIRVIACFMVIMVHACEFFYISGTNTFHMQPGDEFWVSKIDSALRACVPLFVMVSGYLLLPLKDTPNIFYKKRMVRVFVPFAIWSVLYATLPYLWDTMSATEVKEHLVGLCTNFNMSSGHLWFVYMLIGLYLFMPILSPWLKTTTRRFEEGFLLIWFFTTFAHYIKEYVPYIYGESTWSEFSTFWYFSGHIGFLVLAHYIKTYLHWNTIRNLGVGFTIFVVGYVITFSVFDYKSTIAQSAGELELSWRFTSFNVALMACGIFLMLRSIKSCNKKFLAGVQDISKLSYGMYLAHIFVLGLMHKLISPFFSTPITIVLVSISTFACSYILIKALSYLPKSKYLVG